MGDSNFLENLKKAVDTGEFNSEAAKKIIEINKLAEEKISTMTKPNENIVDSDIQKSINNRLKEAGVKTANEEEIITINSEYEKNMQKMKEIDNENKRVADLTNMIDKQLLTLDEIENMVELTIQDMFTYINELTVKFKKEFEEKNPMFNNLLEKINQINLKYKK